MALLRSIAMRMTRFNQRMKERIDYKPKGYIRPRGSVEVGRENFYYINGLHVRGKARFGSYCAIGENLRIIAKDHNYHLPATQVKFYKKHFGEYPRGDRASPVVIGSDVWFGDNVTVLRGVRIGNGACIGAGSLVKKDVPPYTISAGVPAKAIRKRFDDDVIEFLEELKWWDWSDERIARNKRFFMTDLSKVKGIEKLRKIVKE